MDKAHIGIDVSKDWLDIAVHGGGLVRVANDAPAIEGWIAGQIAGRDDAGALLVAFEPTGGHERALRRALVRAGIAFARVHPNEVTAFRARRGVKAKTDRIDARLLAAFAAEELSRRGLAPLVEADERLRALVVRRRQLVEALQAERCRAALVEDEIVRDTHDAVIDALRQALLRVEDATTAHIAASPDLARLAALLRSLKGVGPVTVATLLGDLPELGRLTGKEIAALAGLAPCNRESGRSVQRARTGHGRPGVRRALFNAARCAIRANPIMRETYQRLVTANGRPGKVALTAVMRKMLVTLNAIARDQTPWAHTP